MRVHLDRFGGTDDSDRAGWSVLNSVACASRAGAIRLSAERANRLPISFIVLASVACSVPVLANALGYDFGFSTADESSRFRGQFVRALLEWTAVTVAMLTAATALCHHTIQRQVATPIIGLALFFTGLIDAFHVLAIDDLPVRAVDDRQFPIFTWGLSRILHATIIAIGVAPLSYPAALARRLAGWRALIGIGIVFAIIAVLIVAVCWYAPHLPVGSHPNQFVKRPLDAIALIGYLLAGGLFLPAFSRRHPSLFTDGLFVSLLPCLIGQTYLAFFSTSESDNAAIVAQYLKILAYVIPFLGLLLDFTRVSRSEAKLQTIRATWTIARNVHDSLLPREAPRIDGYDIAGCSIPSGDVGGDYYDFIQLPEGEWLLVIADVAGHDIGASILMSQTRAYLRASALVESNPGTIAQRLNRFLVNEVRDQRFVSLFLARFSPETNQIEYVAAGMRGYLLNWRGIRTELLTTGPILGVIDEELVTVSHHLAPGTMLAVFTDGLTESRNPAGQFFGVDRVLGQLVAYRDLPSADIVQAALKGLDRFTYGAPNLDDLTVVVAKRKA